ncbi:MAG: hypothetical protein A2463_03600 [Candidatus Staskawiczbacteria bacterium RIFOXYC2_FULL_32_10]|nr:MAG: hypothetical protein A2463_03600 [Candidatus Staskawiczbacteria bacterium RIFOXYC2_FULL_32_10]
MEERNKTHNDNGKIIFSAKDLLNLREVLRVSVGKYIDNMSDEDVEDFGNVMLQATVIVLKAKYLKSKQSNGL